MKMKIEKNIDIITAARHRGKREKTSRQPIKENPGSIKEELRLSPQAESRLKKPEPVLKKCRLKPLSPSLSGDKKKWSVLLYLAADNNLEPYITKSLLDLEQVGSTPEINFVAQLDRGEVKRQAGKARNPHGGLPEANRYYVTKSRESQHLTSPVVEKLGKTDSGDYKVLQDFLIWGFQNYPAENYLLIFGDHGVGFRGGLSDDGFKSSMELSGMKKAIQGAKAAAGVDKEKIILGFNACFMAQTEVGYSLKDTAKVMIASEETENYGGWAYSAIFGPKKAVGHYDQEQMINKIMASVKGNGKNIYTQSAIDLSRMDQLKNSVNRLAKAMLSSPEPKANLREVIQKAQNYGQYLVPASRFYGNYRDLYDVAERFSESEKIQDKKLKKAAREVMKSVKDAVSAEKHILTGMQRNKEAKPGHPQIKGDFRGSHGLSINTNYERNLEAGYGKADFAKDILWFDALKTLRVPVRIPKMKDLPGFEQFKSSSAKVPVKPKVNLNQAQLPEH